MGAGSGRRGDDHCGGQVGGSPVARCCAQLCIAPSTFFCCVVCAIFVCSFSIGFFLTACNAKLRATPRNSPGTKTTREGPWQSRGSLVPTFRCVERAWSPAWG